MKDKFLSGDFLFGNHKTDFLLAKDVFDKGGLYDLPSYAKDLFYTNIVDYLDSDVLSKIKDDLLLIFAHGKSTKENWNIYYDLGMYEFVNISELIDYLPKTKNVILYCCNVGEYELNTEKKIIYPMGGTGLGKTKFTFTDSIKDLLTKK